MIAAVLSRDGYRKVLNIVNADQRLEETSAPSRAASSAIRFGRNEYYLAILGTPAATGRWMVQFGGHHIAINVTISGGDSVLTPSHTVHNRPPTSSTAKPSVRSVRKTTRRLR